MTFKIIIIFFSPIYKIQLSNLLGLRKMINLVDNNMLNL